MQRRTLSFAVVSALLLIAAAATLSYLYRSQAERELVAMAQRNNVGLARVFANTTWRQIDDHVAASAALENEALRDSAAVKDLNARILELTHGSSVVEVTIYALSGRIVYSTDEDEIGTVKEKNVGLDVARSGRTASATVWKDHLDTLEGTRSDRNVVESYIPLEDPGAPEGVVAILEVYDDVTDILHEIEANHLRIMVLVGGVMLLAWSGLVLVVGHSNRRGERAHQRALALSAAVARSEAANREKSEFLANMTHELRTPLNAIIGFSEILHDQVLGPMGTPAYCEYAGDVLAAGRRLLGIIDDILDLVKAESGAISFELDTVMVDEVLQQTAKLVQDGAERDGVSLLLDLAPDLPPIRSDEARLRQVVLRLLSNAVSFTPPDGKVRLHLHRTAETLVVEIADTGVGIAPENMPKALAPFGQVDASVTRTHSGTGLGLPLAKRLTELLGGSFAIESAVGRGTTVRLVFPLSPPAEHGPLAPQRAAA